MLVWGAGTGWGQRDPRSPGGGRRRAGDQPEINSCNIFLRLGIWLLKTVIPMCLWWKIDDKSWTSNYRLKVLFRYQNHTTPFLMRSDCMTSAKNSHNVIQVLRMICKYGMYCKSTLLPVWTVPGTCLCPWASQLPPECRRVRKQEGERRIRQRRRRWKSPISETYECVPSIQSILMEQFNVILASSS